MLYVANLYIEQKVQAFKERKVKNRYRDMLSQEKDLKRSKEDTPQTVAPVKGGKEQIRDDFYEETLSLFKKNKKRDREASEEESSHINALQENTIQLKRQKTLELNSKSTHKRMNPYEKARKTYLEKQEEKKRIQKEIAEKQKLRKQKQKERYRTASKLSQKTRKGQIVMNNMIEHIVEKLEKKTQEQKI